MPLFTQDGKLLKTGTSLSTNLHCCCCKCSTCNPALPTTVDAAFPTLAFTSFWPTTSGGGSSYDTCITVTTESIELHQCTCVDVFQESGNGPCGDPYSYWPNKWRGYAGWGEVASESHASTCQYYDDDANEWVTVNITIEYRYYLVAMLVWECCPSASGDKSWKLLSRVYGASACSDWDPLCGTNPYLDDFTSVQSELYSWRCGTLPTTSGDSYAWPGVPLSRVTSTSACLPADRFLPYSIYTQLSSGNICTVVGNYATGSTCSGVSRTCIVVS